MSNTNYPGHAPGGSASGPPSYYPAWNHPRSNLEDRRHPQQQQQHSPQLGQPQDASVMNHPPYRIPAEGSPYVPYPMAQWMTHPPYDPGARTRPSDMAQYPAPFPPSNSRQGQYNPHLRPGPPFSSPSSDTGVPYTTSSSYTPLTVPSVVSAPAGPSREFEPANPLMMDRRPPPRSEGYPVTLSEERSTASTSRGSGRKYIPRKCPHCDEKPRCQSDYKKHVQKHEKPHKCTYPNCKREGGFTTPNDLARHMKSVHKIGGTTKSYRCAAKVCKSRSKVWPRLDNFKQHCARMHKEEDQSNLIQKSEFTPPVSSSSSSLPESAQQTGKEQPMDADALLAGMSGGGSKSLASQFSNPPGNMSLTPDRQAPSWEEGYGVETPVYGQNEDQQGTDSLSYTLGLPAADLSGDGQNLSGPDTSVEIDPALIGHNHIGMLVRDLSSGTMIVNTSAPERSLNSEQFRAHPITQSLADDLPAFAPEASSQSSPQLQALGLLSDAISLRNPRKALRALNAVGLELGASELRSDHTSTENELSDDPHLEAPAPAPVAPAAEASLTSDDERATGQPAIDPKDFMNAILKLLGKKKKKKKKKPGRSSPRVDAEPRSGTGLRCLQCGKVMSRACEMNKHMKRHTRPFGCTFPRCNKKFGSKNDWKRHENGQHFQLENWRCELAAASGNKCGQLFFNQEAFQQHLCEHGLEPRSPSFEQELVVRCIGKNCQGRFWCGFCQEIIKLEFREEKAWDERFDHIEKEHFRKNQNIKDWLCVEANRPKGEVEREMNKKSWAEEDDSSQGGEGGAVVEEDRSQAETRRRPTRGGHHPTTVAPTDLSTGFSSTSGGGNLGRKRKYDESSTFSSSRSTAAALAGGHTQVFCCRCGTGPCISKLYTSCFSCHHIFCHDCSHNLVMD